MDDLTENTMKASVNLTECWVGAANARLEHSLGYRENAPEVDCPPDGKPATADQLDKHENLQNEVDQLYQQRSALTLG